MSHKKEFDLPEKQIKSKLDEIWNEVQTNLPSINFDFERSHDEENSIEVCCKKCINFLLNYKKVTFLNYFIGPHRRRN